MLFYLLNILNSLNKKYILSIGGGLIVVAGGLVTLLAWPSAPNPPDPKAATTQQAVKFVASKGFRQLDPLAQRQYLASLREANPQGGRRLFGRREDLSQEERRDLRRNIAPVFRDIRREEMKKYFDLPPEQQIAHLDELIDRMQQWRDRATTRPARQRQSTTQPRRRGDRGRRQPNPDRMRRRIESTAPEDRAMHAEFRKAMRKRMQERGVEFPRGGGRRGSGRG